MKAIEVLKAFPKPSGFESVYYCPDHPDATIKETVRWSDAPNANPDSRNPVAVHRVVDRWCPVCGKPAVLDYCVETAIYEYRRFYDKHVKPLIARLEREELDRQLQQRAAEQRQKEDAIVEEARRKLGVASLMEWFEKLPAEEQQRLLWELDPVDGCFGDIRNLRNAEAELARHILK